MRISKATYLQQVITERFNTSTEESSGQSVLKKSKTFNAIYKGCFKWPEMEFNT